MLCPEIFGRFGRIFNGILPLNNYTALLKHIEGQWYHATRMFEHVKIQVQNLFIYTYFHSFSKHKWEKVVKDFFDIIIYVHCGKLEITIILRSGWKRISNSPLSVMSETTGSGWIDFLGFGLKWFTFRVLRQSYNLHAYTYSTGFYIYSWGDFI